MEIASFFIQPETPIYLDLGGALAAFGLIFAVYQLRKPQWDLVLRIRELWQRNLFWVFGGIGLFLTLLSVLIPKLSQYCIPSPFNVPLTYEVAAYLFFIASPLSLIFLSTKVRGLFAADNSRRFYEVLVHGISRFGDQGVDAVLEILLLNFEEICAAAKRPDRNDEVGQSARAILDVILSDESVVKVLTTKRLDALQYIFSVAETHSLNRKESNVGIPKVLQNLFQDEESFFYKHLNRKGLALSSNIYESIFESPVLLTNFEVFGYPTFGFGYSVSEDFNLSYVQVFIKALSSSIETYLKTGEVPPRNINSGLEHLSRIFGALCYKISTEEKRGVDTKYSLKDEWWALHLIANFLGHDYPFLAYEEELNAAVAEREKTATEVSFHSNETINAGIAAALYVAFEHLSHIENTTDSYHTVLELLHGMMYEGERKEGYREPFATRMWQQIAANVINRHYPASLRTYLEFIGFCLASDEGQRAGWVGEQAERMRRLLYVDLKPLIDSETLMVNKEKMKEALLPKSMDYKNGRYTYRFGFGEGEEKEIDPPPAGSASALDGVDLKHRSSP